MVAIKAESSSATDGMKKMAASAFVDINGSGGQPATEQKQTTPNATKQKQTTPNAAKQKQTTPNAAKQKLINNKIIKMNNAIFKCKVRIY